jgi:hypothetical protein
LYSVPDTRLHSNLHEHYMPKGALFTIYLVLTLAAPTRLAFPGKQHSTLVNHGMRLSIPNSREPGVDHPTS